MNAVDRLAPLVAGLLIVALVIAGLVYAAQLFVEAVRLP